jgi:YebC/PmpR family DNA-binding regulatory protein
MAGHSKWANIQHRKSAQDNKRAKLFTRIIKEISMAVKEAGIDPSINARLRNLIANAKGANIPKDKIEKAIKKASGVEAIEYKEMTFEGYGPYAIAILVECASDNPTRTVANIRAAFNKAGGNLGKNGEVSFNFQRKGIFTLNKSSLTKNSIEEFELEMIDCEVQEIHIENQEIFLECGFKDFGNIQSKLESMQISCLSSTLQWISKIHKNLGKEQVNSVLKLIEKLEEDEDVQNVYHDLQLNK